MALAELSELCGEARAVGLAQGPVELMCSVMELDSPACALGEVAQEESLLVRMRVGAGPRTAGLRPRAGAGRRLEACCTLCDGPRNAGHAARFQSTVVRGDVNYFSSPTGLACWLINDSCGFFCRGNIS